MQRSYQLQATPIVVMGSPSKLVLHLLQRRHRMTDVEERDNGNAIRDNPICENAFGVLKALLPLDDAIASMSRGNYRENLQNDTKRQVEVRAVDKQMARRRRWL